MNKKVILGSDVLGYTGVSFVLVAFLLLSIGIVDNNQITFFLMNAIGSLIIAIHAHARKNGPILLLNSVFFFVSSLGVLRVLGFFVIFN